LSKPIEQQVSELSGELVSEANPVSVDFAPGFNLEALKLVDPDPVFTTVKIKSGKGNQGKGPYYSTAILKSLETQFNEKRPPGYLGHQDADKVAWEWREPVTAWVGAKFVPSDDGEGHLYVKGYVPSTATALRTQLEMAASGADIVNSVSIFGMRDVDKDQVTNFDLWSLDWTPKGRAGMETELVAVSGEQSKEGITMDRDEVIRSLSVDEVPDHIASEIRNDERAIVLADVSGDLGAVGEMRVILELDDSTDADAVVEAVRTLVAEKTADDLEEKIEEAVAEISNEMARAAVRNTILPKLTPKSTEEEIKGEVASALELPYVVALQAGMIIPVVQGGGSHKESRQGTAWA
jgi:hypothetical protein